MHVKDHTGISSWQVKGGLNTNALAQAITLTKSEKQVENAAVQNQSFCFSQKPIILSCVFQVWLHFYPTIDQQRSCDSCDANGINGDLVIAYDVKRGASLGDIKVHQEFVFSPNIKCTFCQSAHSTFFFAPPPEITELLCSSLCSIKSSAHTEERCLHYRSKWLHARQENETGGTFLYNRCSCSLSAIHINIFLNEKSDQNI